MAVLNKSPVSRLFATPHLLLVVLLSLSVTLCRAQLHFYVAAGSRRCFYRELTANTLLIGKFKMDILDPATNTYRPPRDRSNTGVLVDVEETFDSDHQVVHSRASFAGKFTFSALDSGEHRICFTPKSFYHRPKNWLGMAASALTSSYGSTASSEDDDKDPDFVDTRITIHFEVHDGTFLDSPTGGAHDVGSLVQEVHRLNDKLRDIQREQSFLREREWTFRDQSEQTCATVVRWSLVVVGGVIATCLYQMIALHVFFRAEKKKEEETKKIKKD
ncbi:protein Erp6p [[Candida] anglica]